MGFPSKARVGAQRSARLNEKISPHPSCLPVRQEKDSQRGIILPFSKEEYSSFFDLLRTSNCQFAKEKRAIRKLRVSRERKGAIIQRG
jgi:hypothetical protein